MWRGNVSDEVTTCGECPCHGSHYDDHIWPSKYEAWCGYYEQVFELGKDEKKPGFCKVVSVTVREKENGSGKQENQGSGVGGS
jgi:hypothetical protein